MARDVLKSSFENATFSIIFQVAFRCITFILNAYIIRTVGQEVLGIMNVRLLLLESTILFLSKEPLLKSCLTDTRSHNWAQVINQIWLSVPFSGLLGLLLTFIWINMLTSTDEKYVTQYVVGCYAIAVSCVIEQISQVFVLVAQSFCFVRTKVTIDTFYIVSRTIIFVYLMQNNPDDAIIAFSIAQVGSAIIACLLYCIFFQWYISSIRKIRQESKIISNNEQGSIFTNMEDFNFTSIKDFLPGVLKNEGSLLDTKLCLLTVSFMKQSVMKQILTEGERYVMTVSPILTFSQQSMYDIVNNLGSLAARFIFRPIEESAYFYFSQMIKRDTPLTEQNPKHISEAAEVLSQLCKVVMSIGLLVFVFGQSYSYSFLFLYGGHKLVESNLPVTLLRFHTFAIILLAINGVTEGYVHATMDNEQLDKYNYLMVIFSVAFLLISYIFTYFIGAVGFILANCFNMLARIIHSTVFITKKYKGTNHNPLNHLFPGVKFLSALGISFIVTKLSEEYILQKSIILHIGIGGICFLLAIALWVQENMLLLKLYYNKFRNIKKES
ncbi:unnamed protein product [Phaedon cochleariae]|uniref:Protein RFT1 homolog n=1 Tax=Phaedon cochleariae TaxID=80249 RepID=A0A9P0GWF6_PHACE|nr:unnamed protein product [Phaedon cochleariae]